MSVFGATYGDFPRPAALATAEPAASSRKRRKYFCDCIIIKSKIILLAQKSRKIKINSIEDISTHKYRIGAVLDDVGEQTLLELGVDRARIHRSFKGIHLAKGLHLDRIDMLAYEEFATLWNLKHLGQPLDDYEEIYTLKDVDYYYAFNKDTDDKIITELQTALDRLKASGKFDIILNHYLTAPPSR